MNSLLRAIRHLGWKMFFLLSFVYTLSSLFILVTTATFFVDTQSDKHTQAIKQEVELVRFKIESNLYRDAYLADSLATLVTLTPDFVLSNWKSVAGRLHNNSETIVTIGLSPDDIIKRVYPEKNNTSALELDFRTVPEQYADIVKAKLEKKLYLSGPTELVQGGTGLVARYPIFSNPPYNTEYWGGLSVVIDYNQLLERSGVLDLEGVTSAIVRDFDVIFGQTLEDKAPDFSYPIYVPNDIWYIYSYLNEEHSSQFKEFKYYFYLLGIITFIVIYVLGILLFLNFNRVRELSFSDALTGLPNRRYFMLELDRIASGENEHLEVALLTLDLNDFKFINDNFGHKKGDEALISAGRLLRSSVRTSDIVARLGGDEFVVLLHRFNNESCIKTVIHKIKSKQLSIRSDDKKISCTFSIGYSYYKGKKHDFCVEKLITASDDNMYLDKAFHKAEKIARD
ncbi:diguanylate cyclase domain-containing protein [Vibrio vulnificus]|nr:diguanylate cyclase [Vibrio vulnificus]MCJ0803606.1 sensor domain-containing diguanylate cyclase [Vibrio vulnificus]